MRFDKFTIKVQEAVQAAQSMAEGMGHQQIEPEHLLTALVNQPDNIITPLLQKLGAFPHWNPGNQLLVNQMILSFDFWMSVAVGLACAVAARAWSSRSRPSPSSATAASRCVPWS